MAKHFHTSLRLTRTYVDRFRHLDAWREGFSMKMLGGERVVWPGNGYDDLGAVRYRVIGSKKLPQNVQAQSIVDTLGHRGCAHEYDCCGCLSTDVSARVVRPGVFSVLVRSGRNL